MHTELCLHMKTLESKSYEVKIRKKQFESITHVVKSYKFQYMFPFFIQFAY